MQWRTKGTPKIIPIDVLFPNSLETGTKVQKSKVFRLLHREGCIVSRLFALLTVIGALQVN